MKVITDENLYHQEASKLKGQSWIMSLKAFSYTSRHTKNQEELPLDHGVLPQV